MATERLEDDVSRTAAIKTFIRLSPSTHPNHNRKNILSAHQNSITEGDKF